MNKFVSLCVLSYRRPELLRACVNSIHETADTPYELIINLDGSDTVNSQSLYGMHVNERISKLLLNNGKNRGVGRAFENCLGVAEGDYIVKLDADLTFEPKWLSRAVKILDTNEDVGVVGLFDYNKWDPNDERFNPENNVIKTMKMWDYEYQIVKDFVSSAYIFRTRNWYLSALKAGEIPDDGFHQEFGTMALYHCVDNTAFGVGKSTYVSGTMDHPTKTVTHPHPLVFGKTD